MRALSLLLGQSRLRHLCLRLLFLLVLLFGGLGMLHAEVSEPDGLSAEHVEHIGTFALPDAPEMGFNPETGELETTDAEGKPQRIKLDLPEGGDYASVFPMVITDAGGNEYQVSEQSSTYGVDERSPNRQTEGDSIGGRKALRVERVEHIGAFDREKLERSFGLVRFRSSSQARYALDLGDESWCLGSVKMDSVYREFATEYTAPWKLIPTGEREMQGAMEHM